MTNTMPAGITRPGGWLALLVLAAVSPSARAGGFTGELEVVLDDALFQGADPAARRGHLVLHLAAEDGKWGRLWGRALGYSNGLHEGFVRKGSVSDDAMDLDLAAMINGDLWLRERGRAAFAIGLKRTAPDRYEGTYAGTFKGAQVTGRATAEVKPPRPVEAGFVPVEPGEHPRLLFRKRDVPRLREKLKTPLGAAYREKAVKSWDPVSLGVLYHLAGDPQYAREAEKILRSYDGKYDVNGFGSGGFGHRIVEITLAYDLCGEVWQEDLRKQVRDCLLDFIPRQQQYLMTSHANFHPCSNYYGPGRAVTALATLALWGDRGPEPPRPAEPTAKARPLAPPAGYAPGKGVPVVDFQPGKTPGRWLIAGPLPFRAVHDLLDALGGYERARPLEGSKAQSVLIDAGQFREISLTFQPLEAAAAEGGVDVATLAGADKPSTTILFAALKVDRQQTVGLVRGQADTQVYLAGEKLDDAGFYELKPGLYPMLVVHATAKSAGRIAPRLAAAGSDAFAGRQEAHELDLAFWQAARDDRQRTGGADPVLMRWADVSWRQVCWHYRLGIGDGGFQAETGSYAGISSWYPLVYATAYRKVFGRDASPYPDVTHLMPRRMMQVLFRGGGSTAVDKINSVVGFDPRWCAAALPIVPEKHKPALLWAWNHVTGAKDDRTIGNAVVGDRGLDLAHGFLHYPLDLPGRTAGMKPTHPSEVMPRDWEASTFGFHCFRSGWGSDDDFIAQVFLKAAPVVGWNHPNAGTFRLLGLGHSWTTGPTSRNGARPQEPVVLLPDDEHNIGACGRLAYRKVQADGSAVLTIDMNDVYATAKTSKTPKGEARQAELYDRNLIRRPGGFADSGITGLRAFAFDYSGRSGAPCLMALIDRIDGGGRRLWAWQIPQGATVKLVEDGFVLDQGDATMRATFVSPRGVKLAAGTEKIEVGDPRHGFHGEVSRIKAEAAAGSFFVVATFQRKDAPAVGIDGEGLGAKVTVGGQTVRFEPGPPARIVAVARSPSR